MHIFSKIINVFRVTFDQINASLIVELIELSKNKHNYLTNKLFLPENSVQITILWYHNLKSLIF